MTDPTDNVSRLARIAKTMEAGHWPSSAKVVREAADEIEQMRKDWKVFALSAQLCIDRLTAERDEARRRLCIEWTEHGPVRLTKEQIAMRYGWDCFKENTDA